MAEYQYTEVDAHRIAGIHAGFQWEVDYTTVLGTVPHEGPNPMFVVHVQATETSHGYSYPVEDYYTVTWYENGTSVIGEPTEEQIETAQ